MSTEPEDPNMASTGDDSAMGASSADGRSSADSPVGRTTSDASIPNEPAREGHASEKLIQDEPNAQDQDAVEQDTDDQDAIAQEFSDQRAVEPLEQYVEDEQAAMARSWYIVKVQVNREDSIREALQRRVKVAGLDRFFGDIIVPTEDVAEFTKSGKRRIVKRKLYPGYIVVHMAINDDTWFLVRETPGIGDFTGTVGKPSPMPSHEIEKILKASRPDDEGVAAVRTGIPFKIGDKVRVKEGNFQNFEGDVASIDQANGRVTVTFIFFGRSTPIEIPHWQIEAI